MYKNETQEKIKPLKAGTNNLQAYYRLSLVNEKPLERGLRM
jgi:hypothetical protein